jgi:glycosyltransferase involved in cell wall biosynthesis
MNKTMINYTIIIPHKNIPELLQRCLNSIPRRNDIQIIVVDDNSDSDKADFSNFSGLGEKGVEVYLTKEGKGAGYARNVGLKHAKGKWLLFADADDFFTENAFDIFDSYINSTYKLIYFNTIGRYSDNLDKQHDRDSHIISTIEDYIKNPSHTSLNRLKYTYTTSWARMYCRDLIVKHNIIFDEVPAFNDVMFSMQSAHYAEDLIDVSLDIVYCVTYRKGSLITMENNYNIFLSRYLVTLRRNVFLKERNLSKYQGNTITYIVRSIRFGIGKPFLFFFIALKNKNNPFMYKYKK